MLTFLRFSGTRELFYYNVLGGVMVGGGESGEV